MQPVKLSSSDVSLALRHSLCIMGSGRRAGMEYGCEWRGAQSPVGTWPRWAWTWEVSRDDWDLIYKPLKYFWFARQEIGSRHPLNVCVCVCMHSHMCVLAISWKTPSKEQSPTRGSWRGFLSLRERAEPKTSAFTGGHWPLLPVQNCLRKTTPASWGDVLWRRCVVFVILSLS